MSWDISLKKGDLSYEIGNMTWNVNPMYAKAMEIKGLTELLDGKQTQEVVEILKKGVANMEREPEEYKKLNPSNGFGNYEVALEYLRKIYTACKNNPNVTIVVN